MGVSPSSSDEEYNEEQERHAAYLAQLAYQRRLKRQAQQQLDDLNSYRAHRIAQAALEEELAGWRVGQNLGQDWGEAAAWHSQHELALLWQRHELRWATFEAAPPAQIQFEDVPWPPKDTDMLEALVAIKSQPQSAEAVMRDLSATQKQQQRQAVANYKAAFRKASLRWHPDKFAHRFGQLVRESDRQKIIERVQQVAQAINEEWDQFMDGCQDTSDSC